MLASALGAGSGPGSGPTTPSSAQGQAQGSQGNVFKGSESIVFSGTFLKAGDDNSRWKKRYFQLVMSPAQQPQSSRIIKLQYFENDRDAARNRPPRGELLIENVIGIAVLGRLPQLDPAITSCLSLTSDHVQEGPLKVIIWGRDRLWRLSEQTSDSSATTSELIRSMDRCRVIPKVALRAVGWMRSQGTLSWNRRYAMLFSTGDLLIFKDATLENLRRRVELSKAIEIRPLQPLAPAGSQAEKRVVRMLASGGSWDDGNLDALELVGIRLRHPDIPEKRGYVMCVEMNLSSGEYDAADHYARFRKWLVQLQLSAAEARLSGYDSSRELSVHQSQQQQQQQQQQANTTVLYTEADDNSLERRLYQVVQSSSSSSSASREGALSVAIPYLCVHGSFPPLWRCSLWFVLSGGASLRKNLGTTYSSLIIRESTQLTSERIRILSALLSLDSQLVRNDVLLLIDLFLQYGGEENVFWTLASLTCSLTASSPLTSLQAFFHSGFARYVEAKVVLDLLALKHSNVIAHISSYDLTTELIEFCADFIARCNLPVVWDAVTVWGKNAMSYALFRLLSAKRGEITECFSSDDLKKCLVNFSSIPEDASFWQWKEFDSKVVDQVRRVQWTTLVESLRAHANLVGAWRSLAEESKVFCSRLNQQLNRLLNNVVSIHEPSAPPLRLSRTASNESAGSKSSLSAELPFGGSLEKDKGSPRNEGFSSKEVEENNETSVENDDLIDLVHQSSVKVLSLSRTIYELAAVTEAALDHEVLQTTVGSATKQSNDKPGSEQNKPKLRSNQVHAVSLVPLVEDFFDALIRLAWVCLASAWKSWCRANRRAYIHARFVPRACIGSMAKGPSNSAFSAGNSETSGLYVVSAPPPFVTGRPVAQSIGGPNSRDTSTLGQPLVAIPPGAYLEETPPVFSASGSDGSSLKSIAIGLGKRLFQQRFLNNSNNNGAAGSQSNEIREKKTPTGSAGSKGTFERAPYMPDNAQFTFETPLMLLLKFHGGFVGLCEQAGGPTDVEIIREAMLRDQILMRALDETNVFLMSALHCERLAKWMLSKDPLAPIADVPEAFKHLFIPQQVVYNKEDLYTLEKALHDLVNRTLGTYLTIT